MCVKWMILDEMQMKVGEMQICLVRGLAYEQR
jgi:hypothetical protein